MRLRDAFLPHGNFKVEGSGKTKALVYGGAAAMMLGLLGLMYLLFGWVGSGPPQVGEVTLKSLDVVAQPLQNQIYTTEGGERKDKRRLVPGEVGDSAPTVEYDHSITLLFEGESPNGPFYFVIYDEAGQVYSDKKAQFECPQKPGRYLVCEETYWGQEKNNIGVEYYFWIEVGPEDIPG